MADNPDFKLGDKYTGPAVTKSKRGRPGKVINQKDGTFVEGNVRYIWTGVGDNFVPEGGWGATTKAQAAEDNRIAELELDAYDESQYTQVTRADGSVAPGVYRNNPEYYSGAATAPEDAGAVDKLGNPKYNVGEDRKGNPKWDLNPKFNSSKGPSNDSSSNLPDTSYVNYLRDQNIAGAKSIIEGFLKRFGLAGLTSWAQNQADLGMSSDAITMELRYGTDPTVRKVYDEAFPAMKIRREKDFAEITEVESMELDRGYKQIAAASGLDPKLVGKTQITTLLSNDVSLSEFRDRVQTAEDYVNDLPAEAKAIAAQTYGYTNQDMVSYILDPTLTEDIKKTSRNFDVSRLRAASKITLNQTFSEEIGELLVSNDVQAREISARLSPLAGLTDSTLYNDSLSANELTEASFGLSANSFDSVRRSKGNRIANFSGNSGQLINQEGISTLGRAT